MQVDFFDVKKNSDKEQASRCDFELKDSKHWGGEGEEIQMMPSWHQSLLSKQDNGGASTRAGA